MLRPHITGGSPESRSIIAHNAWASRRFTESVTFARKPFTLAFVFFVFGSAMSEQATPVAVPGAIGNRHAHRPGPGVRLPRWRYQRRIRNRPRAIDPAAWIR